MFSERFGSSFSWFCVARVRILLALARRDWRNRFLSPLKEEYKPLWPPIRTLHRVTRFQIAPCRLGTGRGSETGCVLASEQLFFDFRIALALMPKIR